MVELIISNTHRATNNRLTIKLSTIDRPCNIRVDWGDGTEEIVHSSYYLQHTYARNRLQKEYSIRLEGNCDALTFNNPDYKLISINGVLPYIDPSVWNLSLFLNCKDLIHVGSSIFNDNTDKLSIARMFSGCGSLEGVSDDIFKPLINITSGYGVFNKTSIKEVGNIFKYNTKLEILQHAFSLNPNLKRIPLNMFNHLTNLQNIESIFEGCAGIHRIGLPFMRNTKLINAKKAFHNIPNLDPDPNFYRQFPPNCDVTDIF